MNFRCRACGAENPAMEWNNATRAVIKENTFMPIQNGYNCGRLLWCCPNCSEGKADVRVKLAEVKSR